MDVCNFHRLKVLCLVLMLGEFNICIVNTDIIILFVKGNTFHNVFSVSKNCIFDYVCVSVFFNYLTHSTLSIHR